MQRSQKLSTRDLALIPMFSALMAICSWVSIPATVPFTLQTMGVFLSVLMLGGKRGSIAVAIYLLVGAIGAPVFAGFSGGLGHMLNATGGYIIGFLLSALVMWAMENKARGHRLMMIVQMIAGLFVCYLFGTLWFMEVYAGKGNAITLWTALSWCVIPYILPDLAKIAVAMVIHDRVSKATGILR